MVDFQDPEAALQMREIIRTVVAKELQAQRPKYTYAEVESIDRAARKCMVHYLGDPDGVFVQVNMGSVQPARTGQMVRVDGIAQDRYIQDVLGDSFQHSPTRIVASAEPADVTIASGEMTIRFDATPGAAKVYFKGRDSNGTVVRATLNLA